MDNSEVWWCTSCCFSTHKVFSSHSPMNVEQDFISISRHRRYWHFLYCTAANNCQTIWKILLRAVIFLFTVQFKIIFSWLSSTSRRLYPTAYTYWDCSGIYIYIYIYTSFNVTLYCPVCTPEPIYTVWEYLYRTVIKISFQVWTGNTISNTRAGLYSSHGKCRAAARRILTTMEFSGIFGSRPTSTSVWSLRYKSNDLLYLYIYLCVYVCVCVS